jgi:transcriptional regulator with XRE-family HTH domain
MQPTAQARRAKAIDSATKTVIRAELAKAGRTQIDLAEYLGINQATVSYRFNDRYSWSLGDLVCIGEWLGIDMVKAIAASMRRPRNEVAA